MTEGKPGIMLYYKTATALEKLDDETFGRLVRSMLDYGRTGTEPALEGELAIAWPFLKEKIDEDDARYAKVRTQRQQAVNKRRDRVREAKAQETGAREKATDWMAAYVRAK